MRPDGVNPESRTWPYVLAFAIEMEKQLAENAHKDRHHAGCEDDHDGPCAAGPGEPGWLHGFRATDCMARIYEEVDELRAAHLAVATFGAQPTERDHRMVTEEAADVANMVMMLACISGDLVPARRDHGTAERGAGEQG